MADVSGGHRSCEICAVLIGTCARLALEFATASAALRDLAGSDGFAATWSRCQKLRAEYIQSQTELRKHSITAAHMPGAAQQADAGRKFRARGIIASSSSH
jgi:hypothetical protein